MLNFEFLIPTNIVFGKDAENLVGEQIKPYGKKALLHYGGGSIKKSGLYDRVVGSLKKSGLEFVELGGVQPNPRLSLVRRGIEICRENGVDFILAVGGGSVIDSAKAIGIGAPYDGGVWDFYTGRPVEKTLPVGSVLTIPAAGSECSTGSVITNEDGYYKRATGSQIMRPKFGILNPELTYTLPPYQTACGVTDMIAHVLERYFTTTAHVDLTDRLCEATIRTIVKNAPIVLQNPNDYDARAEIMWAGTVAHADFLSVGRGGDWGSHEMEHELSAKYDIAHGAGLAIIFPAWMKRVYARDVERFVRYAVKVWDVDPYMFRTKEDAVMEGIRRTAAFFRSIGMPVSFADAGLDDRDLDEMARKCVEGRGSVGNFMKLDYEGVMSVYRIACAV